MNIIKYALFIAALSLPVTNTHALEWVDYDGTIPDNAVMVNEGVEDRPICRKNERIGLIKNDLCTIHKITKLPQFSLFSSI